MRDSRRRWFQIHLSTAVATVLLSGVLLGLNFCASRVELGPKAGELTARDFSTADRAIFEISPERRDYGWPTVSIQTYNFRDELQQWYRYNRLSYGGLLMDFAFAFGILTGTAVILEWRIRRREARKA